MVCLWHAQTFLAFDQPVLIDGLNNVYCQNGHICDTSDPFKIWIQVSNVTELEIIIDRCSNSKMEA